MAPTWKLRKIRVLAEQTRARKYLQMILCIFTFPYGCCSWSQITSTSVRYLYMHVKCFTHPKIVNYHTGIVFGPAGPVRCLYFPARVGCGLFAIYKPVRGPWFISPTIRPGSTRAVSGLFWTKLEFRAGAPAEHAQLRTILSSCTRSVV